MLEIYCNFNPAGNTGNSMEFFYLLEFLNSWIFLRLSASFFRNVSQAPFLLLTNYGLAG